MELWSYKSGMGQEVPPSAGEYRYSNLAVVANPAVVAKATLAESAAALAESATAPLHVGRTS